MQGMLSQHRVSSVMLDQRVTRIGHAFSREGASAGMPHRHLEAVGPAQVSDLVHGLIKVVQREVLLLPQLVHLQQPPQVTHLQAPASTSIRSACLPDPATGRMCHMRAAKPVRRPHLVPLALELSRKAVRKVVEDLGDGIRLLWCAALCPL